MSYDPFERLQGLFSITAVPSAGVSLQALQDAILQQLDRLKEVAVSEDELNRVKAQVISSKIYERDSLFYSAMQIGRLEAAGLDRQLLDRYVAEIERVDEEDIRRVAQRYFVETGMSLGRFWPQSKRP